MFCVNCSEKVMENVELLKRIMPESFTYQVGIMLPHHIHIIMYINKKYFFQNYFGSFLSHIHIF